MSEPGNRVLRYRDFIRDRHLIHTITSFIHPINVYYPVINEPAPLLICLIRLISTAYRLINEAA
jgi:hypothetical protein